MDTVKCCKNCKWYSNITTWTYTPDEVKHEHNGYACTVFMNGIEGFIIHKIGKLPENGMCECYEENRLSD